MKNKDSLLEKLSQACGFYLEVTLTGKGSAYMFFPGRVMLLTLLLLGNPGLADGAIDTTVSLLNLFPIQDPASSVIHPCLADGVIDTTEPLPRVK